MITKKTFVDLILFSFILIVFIGLREKKEKARKEILGEANVGKNPLQETPSYPRPGNEISGSNL